MLSVTFPFPIFITGIKKIPILTSFQTYIYQRNANFSNKPILVSTVEILDRPRVELYTLRKEHCFFLIVHLADSLSNNDLKVIEKCIF